MPFLELLTIGSKYISLHHYKISHISYIKQTSCFRKLPYVYTYIYIYIYILLLHACLVNSVLKFWWFLSLYAWISSLRVLFSLIDFQSVIRAKLPRIPRIQRTRGGFNKSGPNIGESLFYYHGNFHSVFFHPFVCLFFISLHVLVGSGVLIHVAGTNVGYIFGTIHNIYRAAGFIIMMHTVLPTCSYRNIHLLS